MEQLISERLITKWFLDGEIAVVFPTDDDQARTQGHRVQMSSFLTAEWMTWALVASRNVRPAANAVVGLMSKDVANLITHMPYTIMMTSSIPKYILAKL